MVYGGGTPTYIVSAKDETSAIDLVRDDLCQRYGSSYNFKWSRLVPLDWLNSDTEKIVDIWKLHY